jgi:predicted transcriptional regulator
MAIRPQGRKRTLSKKVSSFNMWMDQVYQVRAIMESTAATKDAPVIRVLLDEALGARRRKALGISDSEEPPGQGTAETLHTIQTLLLRLIKRGELVFRRQTVDFKLMREAVIEARAGREVAFEELVAQAFMEKGYTRESINNYFDMKSGIAREYVNSLVETIQKEESREYDQQKASK